MSAIATYTPTNLFDATAAGATLAKTLWPSTYTVTLPSPGNVASITNSGSVIGGVFASVTPDQGIDQPTGWNNVLLDFAGIGNASQALVVEIGKFYGTGMLTQPLASVSLTTVVTGTSVNINPFTGVATSSKTWRYVDLTAITAYGVVSQVMQYVGGTLSGPVSQLLLDCTDAGYYYIIVTSLAGLSEALCVITAF